MMQGEMGVGTELRRLKSLDPSMLSDVCVSGVTLVKRRASLTAADAHLTLCAGKKKQRYC